MVKFFRNLVMLFFLSVPSLYAGEVSKKPVNINTASAEVLMSLKGIGKDKAQAILEFRDKNGPFKDIQDLGKVKGIGPKLIEKNKKYIALQ